MGILIRHCEACGHILPLDGIIADPTSGRVSRVGVEGFVRLSPLQFLIFEAIRNSGSRFRSADSILDEIYSDRSDSDMPKNSDTIKVNISQMRKKLCVIGIDAEPSFGFGWRWTFVEPGSYSPRRTNNGRGHKCSAAHKRKRRREEGRRYRMRKKKMVPSLGIEPKILGAKDRCPTIRRRGKSGIEQRGVLCEDDL